MFGVRMTKGDVDTGDFLVLQNVSDNVSAGGIGADGKFAHAIAIFIGASVDPKIITQIFVIGTQRANSIVLDLDDERRALDIAIAVAQIIYYHAINYEHSA